MITRITGTLEGVEGNAATVEPAGGGGLVYEVLVPAYLGERLARKVGQQVTLVTLQYLEGQGQGSSFIPRLIGFAGAREREFFELFTTVKGIGNRRALRAMAVEPGSIAAAVVSKDARALTKLPEIGKRMAETIIAELSGKVTGFLGTAELAQLDAAGGATQMVRAHPVAEEAVSALIALGEGAADAERQVARVLERAAREGRKMESADELLSAVLAGR